MCDILDENFEHSFAEISSNIEKAAFIAIDTEFTGLNIGNDDSINLFDSPEERYAKLRSKANAFIICQFGLSAFVKVEKQNKYEAYSYNFYICPRSQGLLDSKFVWQMSAIEFLCKYNFDFNKFAYHGLSYLNQEDEARMRKMLNPNSLFGSCKWDTNDYEVKSCCSEVASWLTKQPADGEELQLTVSRSLADYVIHKEIRMTFPEVWTFCSKPKEIIVKKVPAESRSELQSSANELDEKLMDEFLGFTKVFSCLLANKKPLIGHNILTDLILLYNQFYRPLPKSYKNFKSDIITMFPKIYDTKYLAYSLSKIHANFLPLKSSNLNDLYAGLDSHAGRFYVLFQPVIQHAQGFERYSKNIPHEAGYDAYICGYAWLRMAHIQSQFEKGVDQQRAVSFNKLVAVMEPFCGCLNLIRARVNHINLLGKDAQINRPQWMIVESKLKTPLCVSEIMETCSTWDSVDIRPINPYKALIAIATFRGAREIFKEFRHHSSFTVSFYNPLRHNTLLKAFLWCSAFGSSAAGVLLLFMISRQIVS